MVADPHRPGHERTYHPGETNLRRADVIVINKIDTAAPEGVDAVRRSIRELNPEARWSSTPPRRSTWTARSRSAASASWWSRTVRP